MTLALIQIEEVAVPIATIAVEDLSAVAAIDVLAPAPPAVLVEVLPGAEGLGTAAALNIHVGATPPADPAVNDVWIDTS